MVNGSTIGLDVTDVGEVVWSPDSPKFAFETDVFICRAGTNERFRKLRSLLDLGSKVAEIGLLPSPVGDAGASTSSEGGMRNLSLPEIVDYLSGLVQERVLAKNQRITIVVDVSCLSRNAQGVLFAAMHELARGIDINLGVGYVLSRYVPPPQKWARAITPVAPVHPLFSGWGDPANAIHVVVGLGYESGKAHGAVQYLEPAQCTPLMPHSPETRFLKSVELQNRDFLKRYPNSLGYEVMQPARTYLSLVSLLSGILRDHRAVLLPFGPKILFALALLAGLTHPQASIWYVEGEDNRQSDEGSPSGHAAMLTCVVTFNKANANAAANLS